jgi:DNA-directed RNA polymerase subunit RPC12/RpoP
MRPKISRYRFTRSSVKRWITSDAAARLRVQSIIDSITSTALPVIRVWSFGNSGFGLLLSRHRSSRHFPAPWRADKTHDGYVVRDANDQALAYVYSHENEADAKRFNELTSDEARRIALVFAALPELLGGETRVADNVELALCPQGEITLGDRVSSQSCIRCGTPMTLVQTEPEDPVHDRLIFECPTCRHEICVRVRITQRR